MTPTNNQDYNQDERNFTEETPSYVDQYQKENISEENNSEPHQYLNPDEDINSNADQNYLDNDFSNALDTEDQDDSNLDYDDDALDLDEDLDDETDEDEFEEDDLEDDDLDEDDPALERGHS